jgi:hypothetical protein
MARKIAVLGAVLLCWPAVNALSAVLPPPGADLMTWPLGGIPVFAISIDQLNQNAEKCGITHTGLDKSLRTVLGQSRIRTLSQYSGLDNEGIILLNVNVLPGCARTITLKVATDVTIAASNRSTLATVWEDRLVRVGSGAAKDTSDAVERLAKEFVDAWNSANRAP